MEKYRTLLPRFCAIILDIILLLPLGIITELIKGAEFSQEAKFALLLAVNLAQTTYFIVMHGLFGQTVGKMLMKVRVLDVVSESAIKFRQAFIRDLPQLLFTIGSFIFLYPLSPDQIDPNSPDYWKNPIFVLMFVWGVSDALAVLTNDKRRALHDYLAGTVVVRIEQNPDMR
ncbi:MAG: RDD family protein [Acidobacteriota bacterium]|nr:RDD family protein [Acidobacteriota bacterium]